MYKLINTSLSHLSLIESRAWLLYPCSSLIYCLWEQQVERGFPWKLSRGSEAGSFQQPSAPLAPSAPQARGSQPGSDSARTPLDTQLVCLSVLSESGRIRPGGRLRHRGRRPSPRRHQCGTPAAFPAAASSSVPSTGLSPGSIPDGKALIFKTLETICAYPLSLTRALPLCFHQT